MTQGNQQKTCPHCGHLCRTQAKVCTQCGYVFPAANLLLKGGRKRCPQCGYENRTSAKVCSQCGRHFTHPSLRGKQKEQESAKASKTSGQKWCPECGNVCNLTAKVCTQCGHHFRTDFAAIPNEPPVIQNPPTAITLPPEFENNPLPPKIKVEPTTLPNLTNDQFNAENAPDLTPDALNAMRFQTPDHADLYARILLSILKKDNGN